VSGAPAVRDAILALLNRLGVRYEVLSHPPVTWCDDSVARRAAAGWKGASSKCIVFHAKGAFYLVVTTAEVEIKARRFKRPFGTKDIRFATPDEVRNATGCEVGSVPPFGHPAPDLAVFMDARIADAEHFMFNPAVPTESVRIAGADVARVLEALPNPVSWFAETADGTLAFTPVVRAGAG
jgi:Ala-tRNA(Pro) deacylase